MEEAAAELHSKEERLQEATRQLLALQAHCTEAATELRSCELASQKVHLTRLR